MSAVVSVPAPVAVPRLLDQLRQLAQARFGRHEPRERYAGWARRFILFHIAAITGPDTFSGTVLQPVAKTIEEQGGLNHRRIDPAIRRRPAWSGNV